MKWALPYRETKGRQEGSPDPLFPVSSYQHLNFHHATEVDNILLYLFNNLPVLFEALNLFCGPV